MTEFISEWSRQKLLCYDVRAAVVTALGYLELMQQKNNITRTNLKIALKNTRVAAKKVDELFQEISNTGQTPTRANRVRKKQLRPG